MATAARVKRFIRNDIALRPGGAAFCRNGRREMRARVGIMWIDFQGSSQLDDRLTELPLPCQRQAQLVVRNRIVGAQQHGLPRVRLGLVEGAVFDERAREVPPRGPVLGNPPPEPAGA